MYTGKSPLGPFKYSPVNPILRKTTGVVTGTGHGSLVKGPDGTWWQFYMIVLASPPGGRRLGMDPAGFDRNGNLFVHGPSVTPQWAPGVVADPARNSDSGSIPLTINKLRNLNQKGSFSSQRAGHEASYAVDESNGTWWEPAESDAQPSITLDLGSGTDWDPPQDFLADSVRIEFVARGGPGRGAAAPAMSGPKSPPVQDRNLDRWQELHHRPGQNQQHRYQVHGIRRAASDPLSLRTIDHDRLATQRQFSSGDHGTHRLWKAGADKVSGRMVMRKIVWSVLLLTGVAAAASVKVEADLRGRHVRRRADGLSGHPLCRAAGWRSPLARASTRREMGGRAAGGQVRARPACRAARSRSAAARMSEDCLYLNVWTPAKSASDRIPVLVWIYGGGFGGGATSIPTYSGEKLAKKGVVLVSIAYRVGPLGFLAHPGLERRNQQSRFRAITACWT